MTCIKPCSRFLGIAIALLTASAAAPAADSVFKSSTTGAPPLKSIEVIRFGPAGLLLIGDGKGAQIIAVETGDTSGKASLKDTIDKFDEKLAGRLGTTTKNLKIV